MLRLSECEWISGKTIRRSLLVHALQICYFETLLEMTLHSNSLCPFCTVFQPRRVCLILLQRACPFWLYMLAQNIIFIEIAHSLVPFWIARLMKEFDVDIVLTLNFRSTKPKQVKPRKALGFFLSMTLVKCWYVEAVPCAASPRLSVWKRLMLSSSRASWLFIVVTFARWSTCASLSTRTLIWGWLEEVRFLRHFWFSNRNLAYTESSCNSCSISFRVEYLAH